jgi:hypothetical protein
MFQKPTRAHHAMRENACMPLEEELQKIYDSEIHVSIAWVWDGGIDINLDLDLAHGNVQTTTEILPWLQDAIAKHLPKSKYHVERMGGKWESNSERHGRDWDA